MRWLLFGKFDPTVAEALRAHGHQALALAEAGIAEGATGELVLAAAQKGQLDLLTDDADTANRPFQADGKVVFSRCIALIGPEKEPGMQGLAIERFFERYPRPSPGRLYTITASRVKVRQLPGRIRSS